MTELDKISIITPNYNGDKYLNKCIENVLKQTYQNIELIIVDDKSTDKSSIIIKNFCEKDPRVKFIPSKEKGGPAKARNIGIKNSTGKLIFFLDSDDFISDDCLNELYFFYKKFNTRLIVGNFQKISTKHSEINFDKKLTKSILLDRNGIAGYVRLYLSKPNRYSLFTHCWGRLFESDVIKRNNILFDENLHTFEDVKFNFEYLCHVDNLYFVNKPIYNHLMHEDYNSSSLNMWGNPAILFGYQQALKEANNYLKISNDADDMRCELGHAYTVYTIIQLIRLCGQLNLYNYKLIYGYIKKFIKSSQIITNIKYYRPSKNDSRVIPKLISLKLICLLMCICNYKAKKRYKN